MGGGGLSSSLLANFCLILYKDGQLVPVCKYHSSHSSLGDKQLAIM